MKMIKLSDIKLNKKIIIILIVLVLLTAFGTYYTLKFLSSSKNKPIAENQKDTKEDEQEKKQDEPVSYPYTLTSYKGTVFGAKVPQGWNVTDNESGIEIVDPSDSNTGCSGIVAVGWYGYQTPDSFIEYMLQSIGATNVVYENKSNEETITDPTTGLNWTIKTNTFTFSNDGVRLKAKASAGIINGYGQYIGMMTAFQTTLDKWKQWAPTLERITKTITVIDPSKAGGIDKVRLPTASDLTNDSSPLIKAWEYRNRSQERTSHEFSDAIMGQESDLYSPSTGQNYTLPLASYDPTVDGYRNPDNPSEILNDFYQ